MNKLLLVFLTIITLITTVLSQDTIYKKDGSTIISKVIEINKYEVRYKKFENQTGPTYIIAPTSLMKITYINGTTDSFPEAKISSSMNLSQGLTPQEVDAHFLPEPIYIPISPSVLDKPTSNDTSVMNPSVQAAPIGTAIDEMLSKPNTLQQSAPTYFNAQDPNFIRCKNSPCFNILGYNPNGGDAQLRSYQECEDAKEKHFLFTLVKILGVVLGICTIVFLLYKVYTKN